MSLAALPRAIGAACAAPHRLRTDVSVSADIGFSVSRSEYAGQVYLDPEPSSCTLTVEGYEIDLFGDPATELAKLRSYLFISLGSEMQDEALESVS